jgi:hypothetical protein
LDSEREFERNALRARAARENVIGQARELFVESNPPGGRALVTRRVREVIEAESHGEVDMVRGAVMELAVAALAWAVRLDLRQT